MRDAIFNPDGDDEEVGPFLAPEDPNALQGFGQPQPPRRPRRPPPARRPVPPTVIGSGIMYEDGSDFVRGGFNMAAAHNAQLGSHLAGMANQVQGALSDENDSRVAQMREMRRMEHEKELERIRQDTLLKRLQMQQEIEERRQRASRESEDRANGVFYSTRWEE